MFYFLYQLSFLCFLNNCFVSSNIWIMNSSFWLRQCDRILFVIFEPVIYFCLSFVKVCNYCSNCIDEIYCGFMNTNYVTYTLWNRHLECVWILSKWILSKRAIAKKIRFYLLMIIIGRCITLLAEGHQCVFLNINCLYTWF